MEPGGGGFRLLVMGHMPALAYVQNPRSELSSSVPAQARLTVGRTEACSEAMTMGLVLFSSWLAGGRISTRFISPLTFSPRQI